MIRLALALVLLAGPVVAQDSRMWTGYATRPAMLVLEQVPGDPLMWRLRFYNENQHTQSETHDLALDGTTLRVAMQFNADQHGAERIRITLPPGWQADRLEMTVPEYQTGTIHLWRGVAEMM